MFLDSVFTGKERNDFFSLEKVNKNSKSTLFSHGRRTESFFTEDSRLYVTPKQQRLIKEGVKLNESCIFDGISARIVGEYRKFRTSKEDFLYSKLVDKFLEIQQGFADLPQNFSRRMTLVRIWNLSVVGAIVLGMVSMTFIYRYLGAGASAIGGTNKTVATTQTEKVLGAEDIKTDQDITEYIEEVVAQSEKVKKDEFEKELRNMVKGHPIEKMLPYIIKKDRIVVAFLIGIANKESGWGEHIPVLNGKDCYNYWGYRGIRKKMGTGGHTCFDSREDAVDTVAKRIEFLVNEKKLNTPAKMSIWKCGSECDKDGQVKKWISDVDMIFKKVN